MEENNKPKKKRNIRVRKRFLQAFIVIFSLTILILSLITLASTVKAHDLAFGRYRFYIMKTESKPEAALKGDLVIAEKLDVGNLKTGDYIVYGDNKTYYCDKVAEIKKVNIVNKVITAENNGVSYQFNEADVSGKVIKNFHKIGNIITFLRTPVGIVFFVLFTICLFALLRILITYGKEDEKKADDKTEVNEKMQ
jgi:hypothetical protein